MQASWLQRAAPPHPIATGMKRASTRAHRPPAAGHDLLQVQSCTEWNIRIGGALSQLEVASQESVLCPFRAKTKSCASASKSARSRSPPLLPLGSAGLPARWTSCGTGSVVSMRVCAGKPTAIRYEQKLNACEPQSRSSGRKTIDPSRRGRAGDAFWSIPTTASSPRMEKIRACDCQKPSRCAKEKPRRSGAEVAARRIQSRFSAGKRRHFFSSFALPWGAFGLAG